MLQTTNPFQHWRRITTDRKVEQTEPVRYPSIEKMFLTELRKEGRDSSRVFRRGFPRGISMTILQFRLITFIASMMTALKRISAPLKQDVKNPAARLTVVAENGKWQRKLHG